MVGKQIHLRMSIYQEHMLHSRFRCGHRKVSVKNQSLEPQPMAEEHRVVAFCVKAVKSSLIC